MILGRAALTDADKIWEILQFAIQSRRKDGSAQWQNGYPNLQTVITDINCGYAYVFRADNEIACYCAIIFNDEPAYNQIDGKWLSTGNFLVVHRVAVSPQMKGKGMVQQLFKAIEQFAVENELFSIKIDTNFDNAPMLSILHKLGYTYCGKVYLYGASRMAFEKVLH